MGSCACHVRRAHERSYLKIASPLDRLGLPDGVTVAQLILVKKMKRQPKTLEIPRNEL